VHVGLIGKYSVEKAISGQCTPGWGGTWCSQQGAFHGAALGQSCTTVGREKKAQSVRNKTLITVL